MGSSSKRASDQAVFAQIDRIRAHRRTFGALARRLVTDVVETVAPDGPLVEVGAGDGQLHAWLPDSARARLLCTEPRGVGLGRLQAAGIEAQRASADALPVSDGSTAAVLGLCVLDVVQRPEAVVAEFRRVLRVGGHAIHWLDMTTELGPALLELQPTGGVTLPNVFGDPSRTTWPEDLFVVPGEQLDLILEVLQRAAHAAEPVLRRYRQRFARPFSVTRATAAFNALNDDPQTRPMLRQAFSEAMRLASPAERTRLRGFQGRPMSSSAFLAARLQRLFSEGFAIVHNAIISVGEVQPRTEDGAGYRSLVAGASRTLPSPPSERLDASAPLPGAEQRLVELGMHTFVARRMS